ncbi:MAG: YbbR-like domain-containing protein [Myxococcales bacterium]|nr:YbbR-like domain-containing protein [Myxococcales bacterium]
METPLEFATVTVSGVQALMRNMRPADMVMALDLSSAREGDVIVDLSERPIRGLPPDLRVAAVNPGTLRLELDRVLKRRLKVAPLLKGEAAEGYAVKEFSVSPQHVDVSGPARVLRAMTEVATEEIDVSGLHEDAEFDVGLGLPKGGTIRVARPGPISVSVRVASTLRQRMFDAVPVVVRGDRYSATLPHVAVTVEGPEALVGGIRTDGLSVIIYAPDEFADAEGSVGPASADGGGLRYEVLGLPSPVRVVLVDPDRIQIIARQPAAAVPE